MDWFENMSDALGIILMVLMGLLAAAAIIRSMIKASKEKNISIIHAMTAALKE